MLLLTRWAKWLTKSTKVMGSILGSTSDLPFHAFEPEIKKSKFKELCWKQSLWSV